MDDTDWEQEDREWEEQMAQEAKERAEREAVRQAALADLAANRDRRDQAQAELDAAREDLAGLLARGQELGLDVSEMALVAGVSRDTAHRRLREVGSVSLREKQRRRERERWLQKRAGRPERSLEDNEAMIRGRPGPSVDQ